MRQIESYQVGDQILVGRVQDEDFIAVGVIERVWHYQGSPRVSMVEVSWERNRVMFTTGDPPETPEEERGFFANGPFCLYPDPDQALTAGLNSLVNRALGRLRVRGLGRISWELALLETINGLAGQWGCKPVELPQGYQEALALRDRLRGVPEGQLILDSCQAKPVGVVE